MRRSLNNLLGRGTASRAKARKARTVRLAVEQLEVRLMPVVGLGFEPPVAADGGPASSVGYLETEHEWLGSYHTGSAVLLSDRLHVLTAAHLFSHEGSPPDPTFVYDLTFQAGATTVTVKGISSGNGNQVQFAPGWTGKAGVNDLAIITLSQPVPISAATAYDIYSGTSEVGKPFLLLGFGRYGKDTDDTNADEDDKRFGYNVFTGTSGASADPAVAGTYDRTLGLPSTVLDYAFTDQGTVAAAPGDSGGPLFIGNQIAGITSTSSAEPVVAGITEHVMRVSAYARWIDQVVGQPRDIVIDLTALPPGAVGKNDQPDDIRIDSNGVSESVSVNGTVVQSAALRRVDSITIIGSNRPDTIWVNPALNRPVDIQCQSVFGNTLNVDARQDPFAEDAFTLQNGAIQLTGTHGTTAITYQNIDNLNLFTQFGSEDPSNPTSVHVYDTSAPNLAVYTGDGDFSITAAAGLQGHVSFLTGHGTNTIKVGNVSAGGLDIYTNGGTNDITLGGQQALAASQVYISGTGQNALTIDDSADTLSRSVVIGSQSVSFGSRLPGASADTTIFFNPTFLTTLVVKTGTANFLDWNHPYTGTSVVVEDTPYRPFGSTYVSLYTGQGDTSVQVETLSSQLSIFGQGGQDTVTLGRNNSLAGIRNLLAVSNAGGSTQLNFEGSADNFDHSVQIYTTPGYIMPDGKIPDPIGWVVGLAPATILFNPKQIRGLAIATGGTSTNVTQTINVKDVQVPLTISTGACVNNIIVSATSANATLDLNLGAGRNRVTVGTTNGLSWVQGQVNLHGAGGHNEVVIDDRGEPFAATYTLDATRFQREGCGAISFNDVDRIASLLIWGSQGNEEGPFLPTGTTFNVSDTPANAYTTLYTADRAAVNVTGSTGTLFINPPAGGLETVTIGGPARGLDPIQGSVWLGGDDGMDVFVDDSGATTPQAVTIDRDGLSRSGAAMIHYPYAGNFPLSFRAGSGGNTVNVEGTRGGLTLLTGPGNDRLYLGSAAGTLSNLGHVIVNTSAGGNADLYLIDRGEAAGQTYEFGGVSNEPYFSNIPVFTCPGTTVVLVNAAGDTVTPGTAAVVALLGGGGPNTVNVGDAWAADNVAIDAGPGNNIINGGAGRELLIGGGASVINGGSGQDILVAGGVAFGDAPAELTALTAIMAEWGRTDVDYATRVDDLLYGGGLNGTTVLNPQTYRGNGGGNTLTGGADLNLFFGSLARDTSNYDPTSGAVFVDPDTFQPVTTIDATALAGGQLLLDGTAYDATAQLGLLLRPGSHSLQGAGGDALSFTVAADGTVDYDPSLDGVLSGRGTGTLTMNDVAPFA